MSLPSNRLTKPVRTTSWSSTITIRMAIFFFPQLGDAKLRHFG
jgi:hypothetical protein